MSKVDDIRVQGVERHLHERTHTQPESALNRMRGESLKVTKQATLHTQVNATQLYLSTGNL